jgi:hypothetical protein
MKNNFAVCVVALGLSVAGMHAQQAPGMRTVFPWQTTLSESGNYVLNGGLTIAGAGDGILITGSNITLDLNGQTISGSGMGVGVRIMGGRNIVLKNGTIERAAMGVVTMNARNVSIEGLKIMGSMGAPPEAGVMMVQTVNSVVKDNQILNTALGIFVRGGQTFGNRIVNNTITAMGSTAPLGICYNPSDTDPQGPKGDLISGNLIRGYRQAVAFSDSSEFNVVTGNTFIFRVSASSSPSTTNIIKDNTEVKLN